MDRHQQLPGMLCTCLLAALVLWSATLVGCAELSGLNPYYRQQWAEDERIMPSYHTYLQQIRDIESQVAGMDAAEQQRVAGELTRLIRDDQNKLLRLAAVRSLSQFPPDLSRTGVLLAASDADRDLRVVACAALARLGDEQAIGLLASLVEKDTDLDVRVAAAGALAGRREAQAFQALGLALDDSNPALQFRAMQSLRESSGRDYGNDIALWRAWLRGENPQEPTTSVADRFRSILPY